MSDDAYGATVAKRRLSRQLLQLRLKSGYTANHVCDMLNWGRGKVGRFEANQWKRPEMSDIRDLLRIYGVDPAERDEIEELAIRSRARPWWRDCAEIFENEFPGFENDASRIRVFIPLVLPGLNTRILLASFSNPGNSFSKISAQSRHHGRARERIARSSISSRSAGSTL